MTGRILRLTTAVTWGSYYFEDITRIRRDRLVVPERYHTKTEHGLYPKVRTPAPAVSVGLVLDNGRVAWGDCVPVSFSGKSGRAMPKEATELSHWIIDNMERWFIGKSVESWMNLESAFLEEFSDVAAFVRYGISQAMLAATSMSTSQTYWRILAHDLGLDNPDDRIPLHGSCGGDWGDTVDRMLAHHLKFLPQGQFEFLHEQIGPKGEALVEWILTFKARAHRFGYEPTLTLDFHGALDELCHSNLEGVADLIAKIARAAAPFKCHIESPLMASSLESFTKRMCDLRERLAKMDLQAPHLRLVADEWANEVDDIRHLVHLDAVDGVHIKMPDTGTLSQCAEAVQILKKSGKFSILGGSCTETILGSKCTAHLAAVARPSAVLVKPGMGFDESFAYLDGEMARAIAEAKL